MYDNYTYAKNFCLLFYIYIISTNIYNYNIYDNYCNDISLTLKSFSFIFMVANTKFTRFKQYIFVYFIHILITVFGALYVLYNLIMIFHIKLFEPMTYSLAMFIWEYLNNIIYLYIVYIYHNYMIYDVDFDKFSTKINNLFCLFICIYKETKYLFYYCKYYYNKINCNCNFVKKKEKIIKFIQKKYRNCKYKIIRCCSYTGVTDENICVICCSTIINNSCILTCGHKFHSDCISKWKHIKNDCPICRQKIDIICDNITINV